MQVRLFVSDRVLLLQLLLNQPGHPVLLQLVQRLMSKLSFSEQEIKGYKLTVDGGGTHWDSSSDEGRQFTLGDRATQICRDTLERFWAPLQKAGEMNQQQASLWFKFFPEAILSEEKLDELLEGPEELPAPEVPAELSEVVKKLAPEDIAALIRAATAATSTGSGA